MSKPLPGTNEAIQASLRTLYRGYGYSQYKMNKFEEYDLYAHNKDFLISGNVITFTDGNGKLLALKPDVTLSIVKNSRDAAKSLQKLYYNENVYRIQKGSRNFKEIPQMGLECIGNVDSYCIYEVLALALGSLRRIDDGGILGVSHLGILSEVMDAIGIGEESKPAILRYIGEKNLHELSRTLLSLGISEEKAALLRRLVTLRGTLEEINGLLPELLGGTVRETTLSSFRDALAPFGKDNSIVIDFSLTGDIRYYNGFVFKGFIEGIPSSVLSGGQYDLLVRRMGHSSGAIGFAVYLDLIEQYRRAVEEYDVDTVILYDTGCPAVRVADAVRDATGRGETVYADRVLPESLKYKKLLKITDNEGGTSDDNA